MSGDFIKLIVIPTQDFRGAKKKGNSWARKMTKGVG